MRHLQLFLYCFLAIVITTTAQSSSGNISAKLVDDLVGTWTLSKVFNGSKEMAVNDHVGIIERIEFTEENMYLSKNNEAKIDSGLFRTNEIDHLLYLETANKSTSNPTTEWSIRVNKKRIILSRREPMELRRYKYVYIREIPKREKTASR